MPARAITACASVCSTASNLVNTLADGSTIVNFENYDLYGENTNNSFVTLGGADHITDTVKAGAGDDYIRGGPGSNRLYDEAGNDTIFAGVTTARALIPSISTSPATRPPAIPSTS